MDLGEEEIDREDDEVGFRGNEEADRGVASYIKEIAEERVGFVKGFWGRLWTVGSGSNGAWEDIRGN